MRTSFNTNAITLKNPFVSKMIRMVIQLTKHSIIHSKQVSPRAYCLLGSTWTAASIYDHFQAAGEHGSITISAAL